MFNLAMCGSVHVKCFVGSEKAVWVERNFSPQVHDTGTSEPYAVSVHSRIDGQNRILVINSLSLTDPNAVPLFLTTANTLSPLLKLRRTLGRPHRRVLTPHRQPRQHFATSGGLFRASVARSTTQEDPGMEGPPILRFAPRRGEE